MICQSINSALAQGRGNPCGREDSGPGGVLAPQRRGGRHLLLLIKTVLLCPPSILLSYCHNLGAILSSFHALPDCRSKKPCRQHGTASCHLHAFISIQTAGRIREEQRGSGRAAAGGKRSMNFALPAAFRLFASATKASNSIMCPRSAGSSELGAASAGGRHTSGTGR